MSSINVNTIKSRLGGPPTLPSGVVVSAAATFSSDVSIGGTLTYEDVTNITNFLPSNLITLSVRFLYWKNQLG